MARKPCTTSGLAHRHAPIASQLSVKYTSENRETEWIAAILLVLPQSYLLKWQLRFHSDLQKLQLLAHKAVMNVLSQSMDAWLNIAHIWFSKLFCLTATRVLGKKKTPKHLYWLKRNWWSLLVLLHRWRNILATLIFHTELYICAKPVHRRKNLLCVMM